MSIVEGERCRTCKAQPGERHRITTPRPTDAMLKSWQVSRQAEATDGCPCEPNGLCAHGHYSWLVTVGRVTLSAQASANKFRQSNSVGGSGQPSDRQNPGQENNVAKSVNQKGAEKEKTAGGFREGSAIGNLFALFKDGKVHTLAEVKAACKGTKNVARRLFVFQRNMKRRNAGVLEKVDDTHFRMRASGKAASAKAEPAKAEKKAPAKAKSAPDKKPGPSVADDTE